MGVGLFGDVYRGRTVLVTGHTGFKGSWLCLWLDELGADVVGYALSPSPAPNHFRRLRLKIRSITGDIRDFGRLARVFQIHKPEVVFHLAAQPLVRHSYMQPRETFETNVIGTVNVLEACRGSESVRAAVNVTSDKCYENREWVWGYRENDPMGGRDPYSASKGCSELVTDSYRSSFFNPEQYGVSHHVLLASARSGNVIGGGDWAKDRLVPDIMKAAGKGGTAVIRNPKSVRPWMHVLEPLAGYLMLGRRLLQGEKDFATSWNFGPGDGPGMDVAGVAAQLKKKWGRIRYGIRPDGAAPHEAGLLRLDCSKANLKLGWRPLWDSKKSLSETAGWYKAFYEKGEVLSRDNLNDYISGFKNRCEAKTVTVKK